MYTTYFSYRSTSYEQNFYKKKMSVMDMSVPYTTKYSYIHVIDYIIVMHESNPWF